MSHEPMHPGAILREDVLPALELTVSKAARTDEIPMIDAHSQLPTPGLADDIIRILDAAGIRRVILSFRGSARMGHVFALASAHPDRITGAIKIKGRHWDQGSKSFYQSIAEQRASGAFVAIGEALLYHAAKGDKAPVSLPA